MRKGNMRILLAIDLFAFFLLFQGFSVVHAKEAEYPMKPIEFVIGQSAGGSNDIAFRALNKVASTYLGQPIVTLNKPGGNGAVARRILRNAPPDGYTLGNLNGASLLMAFSDEPAFKTPKDFTWIMSYGNLVYVILVQEDAPWKNWGEFINWAKKNPRATKIGVTGAKAVDYKAFNLSQIENRENAEFTYIVFKSSAEMLTSILGGHTNMYAGAIDASTMSYVKERKLRILAFIALQRISGYESIPSLEEMYRVRYPNFLGVGGNKGIPAPVVRKLEDVYKKAMNDPEFIGVMKRMEVPIRFMDSVTVTKYAEECFAETERIIEKVKAEEAKKTK
jgi:tripartite-type tricarboxylate transporter receptor subunit TctC